ncbi:MAG TPA: hypothetical protein VE954_37415 [Oligoflexus sp.]|uniref:hypothetical protein n=1 Tax=Oligoflexus sp. TaxID=1971216 RepID=UPI002D3B3891|nr:hypothetical protein [Oligoflexus sp.]HYX38820.1 hypothetical protein [Oligoflexus sp.]
MADDGFETDVALNLCKAVFNEDVTVKKIPESRDKTPDIQVVERKLLIEVKRIDNPQANKQNSMWAHTVERLKDRLEKEPGWSGEFYITTTGEMHISKINGQRILEEAVQKILPIISNFPSKVEVAKDDLEYEPDEDIFVHVEGNVHFKIVKATNEGKAAWFDSMDFQIGFPEIQFEEIKKNIEKADKQLSKHIPLYPDHEKWLVFPIMDLNLWGRHSEIQKVIDQVPNNIDQIWGINWNGDKPVGTPTKLKNP